MPLTRYSVTIILCLIAMIVNAQEYTFVRYGQEEGLAHTQVLDITQDTNGNLWLGTSSQAIYRFDGKKFYQHKISVPGSEGSLITFRILADSDNQIWALTNQGLLKFNGAATKKIYSTVTFAGDARAKLFLDKKQNIWLIDDKGSVFQAKNDSLKLRSDITSLAASPIWGYYFENENLIFHTSKGLLVSITPTGVVTRGKAPWELHSPLTEVIPSEGSTILSTFGNIHEISDQQHIHTELPESVNKHIIKSVARDRHRLIWVLVANKVFVIDKEKKLSMVSGTESLPGNYSNCLFLDAQGDVWISVDGVGILKYKMHAWKKLSEGSGSDITCMSFQPSTGKLLLGTYANGLIGQDRPLLVGKPITNLAALDNNCLLAATLESGLFKICNQSISKIQLGTSPIQYVHGVASDGQMIVAGTHDALYVIKGNETKRYQKKINGRWISITIPTLVGREIYAAGMSAGLLKVSGDSIIQIGPEFLNHSTIYNIRKHKSGGYLVTGEFPKLFFFDEQFKLKRTIDLSAFASNVLIAEFLDSTTAIIGSNDGLFKVSFRGDTVVNVKKYGKADGYGGEELYGASSVQTAPGEIVVGTVGGAYTYHSDHEEANISATSVYLTQVEWTNQSKPANTDGAAGYFRIPVNPKLRYDQNRITFSYDYNNLENPNNITFRHQLVGIENSWSTPTTSTQVIYSNLPPGGYVFKVQAIGEDKVFGNISQYAFEIIPAFWQTSAFVFSMAAAAVAAIILMIRLMSNYRIKKHEAEIAIRAEEAVKIRKQMAMDFHDEMGNKLAGMLAQSSLLKLKHKETEWVSVFDYFEKTSYAIYHGTKDFIWSTHIESNNLKEVILYLREFGYNFFERNKVTFHVEENIQDDAFSLLLPEGYNRQIILIFKEAMTNALKHSNCKNVFFGADLKDGTVNLTFSDDGIWSEAIQSGNGVKNMRLRASKMNAGLVLSRLHNRTTVSLSIKL